jgi:preprotein translocase subunit SecG
MTFPILTWKFFRSGDSNHKETHMSLDKIIVIVLALLFFGGVLVVALKNRQNKGTEDQSPSPPTRTQSTEGVSPFPSQEKEKRKAK